MRYGITILGIATVLCSSLFGVIYWRFANLPHPSEANPNQLGYWLVLRDLSEHPTDVQIALVDRLIEDSSAIQGGGGSTQLTDGMVEQLKANMDTLKFAWFSDRVRKYVASDNKEKWSFLTSQIDVVADWAALTEKFEAELYPDATGEIDHAAMFFDEVEGWLGRTAESEHEQAYDAVADAMTCWLATSSLEDQDDTVRLELANRITRELDLGSSVEGTTDFVPSDCISQLYENIELILEAWLIERAREYAALDDRKAQTDFADELIGKVEKWNVLSLVKAGDSKNDANASSGNSMKAMAEFSAKIDSWIARANPEDAKALGSLTRKIKLRLFAKSIFGR